MRIGNVLLRADFVIFFVMVKTLKNVITNGKNLNGKTLVGKITNGMIILGQIDNGDQRVRRFLGFSLTQNSDPLVSDRECTPNKHLTEQTFFSVLSVCVVF